MILDNFNLFRDKLKFIENGDFYVIHIVLRNKDVTDNSPEIAKILSKNIDTFMNPYFRLYQHLSEKNIRDMYDHRIINTYFINSIEQYNSYENEIKELCRIINARAYIGVAKQNKFTVWDDMRIQLDWPDHNIYRYNSFIDRFSLFQRDRLKTALIDLDGDETEYKDNIINDILKWRFQYEVPSPNGCHLIFIDSNENIMKEINKILPHKLSMRPATILYYNDEYKNI